jgi:hypothetical protein
MFHVFYISTMYEYIQYSRYKASVSGLLYKDAHQRVYNNTDFILFCSGVVRSPFTFMEENRVDFKGV